MAVCILASTLGSTFGVSIVTLDADRLNRGNYTEAGLKPSSIGTTFVGQSGPGGNIDYHSYFGFDISGVQDEITGAKLYLQVESYWSPNPSETISLFDVSTSRSDLAKISPGTTLGQTIFQDLGTGASYGSAVIFPSNQGLYPINGVYPDGNGLSALTDPTEVIIEFTLNAAAIAALNAGDPYFAVGLHLDTLNQDGAGEGVRFSNGGDTSRKYQLQLTVPDSASTLVLLSIALGFIALGHRGAMARRS